MAYIDVFNGDADGLCALVQLRLHHCVDSLCITGVKRDIALLDRVEATAGDTVTVLDISLDKNRDALCRLLATGATIHYFDHHFAGTIPQAPNFTAHIDTAADVCTSLLVNACLNDFSPAWAVAGAFGDNLDQAARSLAARHTFPEEEIQALAELGTLLNYNAYGETEADLHIRPLDLFRHLLQARSPLTFMHDDPVFRRLREGYHHDMEQAGQVSPELLTPSHALYIFPDTTWARRASGVLANRLASAHPQRAHALLTRRRQGGYLVSVRAPLNDKRGADALCRRFPSGGGRAAAAGINHLPEEQLDAFIAAFTAAFRSE